MTSRSRSTPSSNPIAPETEGEAIGFVAERYNAMIESAQASLEGYNTMRETLREKLGDHSSLEALTERLESLSGETLANLQRALSAMNDGDLTISVDSATSRSQAAAGENIGHLAEVFNEMLDNTQASVSGLQRHAREDRRRCSARSHRARVAVGGVDADGVDLRGGRPGDRRDRTRRRLGRLGRRAAGA